MLRESVLAARAARPPDDAGQDQQAIARHGAEHCRSAAVVAAYAAVGAEPPTRTLLDDLTAAGIRVLLPVVAGADLAWGDYTGWQSLRPGQLGVPEPLVALTPAEAAAVVEVSFVPALAVGRDGYRLGRGAGFYDRWLARLASRRDIVAVVYADEVLDAVPHEQHDIPVTAALTPAGIITLGHPPE